MSHDIDYIEIDGKDEKALLVATVTRLNTLTKLLSDGQAETNAHLRNLNGNVARNVTNIAVNKSAIDANRQDIGNHSHLKRDLAIIIPLCSLIGILVQVLLG